MKRSSRPSDLRKIFLGIFSAALVSAALVFYSIGQETREADQCLSCHGEPWGINQKFQHPLIKEGKCRSCHNTYDEAAHQEREKPVLETCLECHREGELGRSHPVGGGVIDPNTQDTLTCVSTCHSPHGADYEHQLAYKNVQDLCLSCHRDF